MSPRPHIRGAPAMKVGRKTKKLSRASSRIIRRRRRFMMSRWMSAISRLRRSTGFTSVEGSVSRHAISVVAGLANPLDGICADYKSYTVPSTQQVCLFNECGCVGQNKFGLDELFATASQLDEIEGRFVNVTHTQFELDRLPNAAACIGSHLYVSVMQWVERTR